MYYLIVLCVVSVILNILSFRIMLSKLVGTIHTKDDAVWIELQNENSLKASFGIVLIKKH